MQKKSNIIIVIEERDNIVVESQSLKISENVSFWQKISFSVKERVRMILFG